MRAGQALQRVLLTAAAAGLTACLQTQVIAVPAAREQVRLALGRFGWPQVVLRIGYRHPGPGPLLGPPAPRRVSRAGPAPWAPAPDVPG
ncbi:hypothetical protein Pen02_23910 [Plantactinospora endophytica]|uniref:Nitroreductase domain-containing protein n=1 Tax=Plantactinospora endophytica TaxID=673535 RepID=A0ABQ4DYC3_9ACTN|nr:hypothetical protein [Plantactinospora endophytica]GIG87455.1 hypothetical protein Pen02_23910 [Plantactinospora endophytica]